MIIFFNRRSETGSWELKFLRLFKRLKSNCMTKAKLFIAGILLSGIAFTSCGREGAEVQKTPATVVFAKTPEMLNFESALKTWMRSKHEASVSGKINAETKVATDKAAKDLLVSLGKSEVAGNGALSTDELVRATMKEYSKKLTEMSNQQKNN